MAELEIDRDERVVSGDGMEIGRVKHVIVDSMTKQVTDLVVEQNHEERLIPITEVERGTGGELMLRAAPANAMHFMRDEYHAVDEDEISTMRASGGGTGTVESATDDSVVIDDARAADMSATTRQQPMPEKGMRREQTARDGENITVPVVEEKLKAGVRETEAGKFRLSKRVVEEQKSIDVPVEREEVFVTDRAVNRRPATAEDMKMMDRDIEVPLREQEVVTSKEARVTGEVQVRKEVKQETERVTDTVRREEVRVEKENPNNPHIHIENEEKRKP